MPKYPVGPPTRGRGRKPTITQRVKNFFRETLVFDPNTKKISVDLATATFSDDFVKTDYSKIDYLFFEQLYRCEADTQMSFGGALVKPIINVHASYEMKDGFTLVPEDITGENTASIEELSFRLNAIFNRNMHILEKAARTAKKLGKCFVGINTAGKLEVIHPERVKYAYSKVNPEIITYFETLTKFTTWDPEQKKWIEVEDTLIYTPEIISYHRKSGNNEIIPLKEEANLWGLVPYVEINNYDSVTDKVGYPLPYFMLPLLSMYHKIFVRSGASILYHSNPIPCFSGVGNVQNWLEDNFGGITTTTEGTVKSESQGALEQFHAFVSANPDFKASYLVPDSAAVDAPGFLKKLYLLILENSSTPEFILGAQMVGSNSTVKEQWASFEADVKSNRNTIWSPAIKRLAVIFAIVYASDIRDPLNPDDLVSSIYPSLIDTALAVGEFEKIGFSITWPEILPRQTEINEVVLENLSARKLLAPEDRLRSVKYMFDNIEEVIKRAKEFWGEEFGKGDNKMDAQAFGSPKDQRDTDNQKKDTSNFGQGRRGAK